MFVSLLTVNKPRRPVGLSSLLCTRSFSYRFPWHAMPMQLETRQCTATGSFVPSRDRIGPSGFLRFSEVIHRPMRLSWTSTGERPSFAVIYLFSLASYSRFLDTVWTSDKLSLSTCPSTKTSSLVLLLPLRKSKEEVRRARSRVEEETR